MPQNKSDPPVMADILLPSDFAPVVEVSDPDGKTHKIYADPIGTTFLKKILEQNRQMLSILHSHAELFRQLDPHISRLVVSENSTSEEQTTTNNHIRTILEIFANFAKENT